MQARPFETKPKTGKPVGHEILRDQLKRNSNFLETALSRIFNRDQTLPPGELPAQPRERGFALSD